MAERTAQRAMQLALAMKRKRLEMEQRAVELDPTELMMAQGPVGQSVEAGLVGAGETFTRAGQGVQRLFNMATGDQEQVRAIEDRAAEGRHLTESLRRRFPVASFAGAAAPVAAIPGFSTVGGATAIGAGLGATQPEGNPLINAAVGAGLSGAFQGVGRVAGNMIGGRGRVLGAGTSNAGGKVAGKTAAERARSLGVEVPPRVESNSRVAALSEASGRTNIFTAGAFDAADDRMAEQLNQAVLSRFGQKGKELTGKLVAGIRKDISDSFESFASTLKNLSPTAAGPTLARETVEALDDAVAIGANGQVLAKQVEAVNNLMAGKVRSDGKGAFELLRRFRDAAMKARRSNAEHVADFYDALQAQVMDGMEGGSSLAAKRTLRSLRRDWRDISMLEDPGMLKNGRIMPGTLNSRLERSRFTRRAYNAEKETGNQLWEVGRFGEQMQVQKIGSSGTAERGQNALSAVASLPIAALGAAQTLSPRARAILGTGVGETAQFTGRAAALQGAILSSQATGRRGRNARNR